MARNLSPETIEKNRKRASLWGKLNPQKATEKSLRYQQKKKQETERLKQENEELKKQLESVNGTQQKPRA